MKRRRIKYDSKWKILMGILVLTVILGLASVTYSDPKDTSDKQRANRPSVFDPFKLDRVTYITEREPEEGNTGRPSLRDINLNDRKRQIWVPRRPVCRSPIRPQWTR